MQRYDRFNYTRDPRIKQTYHDFRRNLKLLYDMNFIIICAIITTQVSKRRYRTITHHFAHSSQEIYNVERAREKKQGQRVLRAALRTLNCNYEQN